MARKSKRSVIGRSRNLHRAGRPISRSKVDSTRSSDNSPTPTSSDDYRANFGMSAPAPLVAHLMSAGGFTREEAERLADTI
jgi:hypothetical protein